MSPLGGGVSQRVGGQSVSRLVDGQAQEYGGQPQQDTLQ